MSRNLILTSGLAGGSDVQFSRPDFKIAVQSGTGSSNFPMELTGYQHLRSQGIRLLWNLYDTTTVLSPSNAGGDHSPGRSSVDAMHTDTTDAPDGFSITRASLAPYLDMIYVDDESARDFSSAAKDDRTFTAGNGGVAGDTITVTAGDISSIKIGDRLRSADIPSEPDECYVSNISGSVITMRQIQYSASYPYTLPTATPSIAVPNGSTITARGRVNDAIDFTTQVKSRLAYYDASSKLLGMYGHQWSGPSSYVFHQASGLMTRPDIVEKHAQNSGCTQHWVPYWDFLLPELYAEQMELVSVMAQWWCKAKDQYSSDTPIYPLLWPYKFGQMSYKAATNILEYCIRCPQLNGVGFWAVSGVTLPAAAPTWYEGYTGGDPDFPWMIAVLDFIDKYGLSV